MKQDAELKCCPFCGSEDIHIWIEKANNEDEPEYWNPKHEIEQNDLFELYCNGCDFCSGKFCRPEHVIDKWNRRYDHAAAELRWIPVSERLPEQSGMYLVTMRTGKIAKLFFDVKSGWITWAEKQNVLAWMPLPKPYTEPADNIGEEPVFKEFMHTHIFQAGDPEQGWENQCSVIAPDGLRHCGGYRDDHPMSNDTEPADNIGEGANGL